MTDEERIIAIETKIAYQEDLLHTLNDTIVQQQQKISALEQCYQTLLERLATYNPPPPDTDPDERPPHY